MRRMFFVTAFAVVAVLSSCSARFTEADLLGVWVAPVSEGDMVQGFRLDKGGVAYSINMATLVYESWKCDGDLLILNGRSLGNGQNIEFADTLHVAKADGANLVLSGADGKEYRRADAEENWRIVEIVRGEITFAHEVREFRPDGDTASCWLVDRSGYLQKMYLESGQPEWRISAELVVQDAGKSEDGFGASYAKTYQVIDVISLGD